MGRPSMKWFVDDCTALSFEDETFDLAIDKCTMESFGYANDSVTLATAYIKEMFRVLRRDGTFVHISHGRPETNMQLLQNHGKHGINLAVSHIPLDDGVTFVYVCRRSH